MAMDTLINLLVQLVIAGIVVYVLFWAINTIGIPEPFRKVAIAIVVLIVVLFLLHLLMGASAGGLHFRW